MTAASAPEEGRKCWLKVNYEGRSRLVEWNTAWGTFKDMDTKVRKMFSLNDKVRLVYTYQETITDSEIVMSSDEELGTALHLLRGEILFVNLSVERKKRKGPLCRLMRAAKAQQPRVTQFVTSLPANVAARIPAVPWSELAERVRASAQASCAARCGRANAARACRMRGRKIVLGLFVLIAAVLFAHSKCHQVHDPPHAYTHNTHHQYQYQHHFNWNQQHAGNQRNLEHATILAASYGGKDVTRQAQGYYNKHQSLWANNAVFGDSSIGQFKYLHVVFQHLNKNGVLEVYSQTFPESIIPVPLSANRVDCRYPEEAIVDGRSVKVLGALYDNTVATCAARQYAATGNFGWKRSATVQSTHFGVDRPNGQGAFTMVYMKDNVIRMVTAKDGQTLVL